MTVRCSECGESTAWNDDAASEICTTCGTLTDSNQCVLTTQDYLNDPNYYKGLWDPAAPTTLKTRSNWDLAGQSQEARDRKNFYTMATFIKSLAVSLNAAGLSPRAVTLFNQAKAVGLFGWGSKAKSVAGACLAIALREANRPDSLHDIAFLLKSSPQLLSRTFISLTSALKISTISVDPSVHISTLQNYLAAALQEHQAESNLPSVLLKSLQSLCLRSVANTATSLCNVRARLCPSDDLAKSTAGPTACAIFMLSLEAEARSALNSLGDLAKFLGARCHVGRGIVMTRYKSIQDEMVSLAEKVPWLDKYESKGGRAKVSRRVIVARGLKDVIKFHQEIFQNIFLPDVQLELTEAASTNESGEPSGVESISEIKIPRISEKPRLAKRRKIHRSLDEATQFLLDPLYGSIPLFTLPSRLGSQPGSQDSSSLLLTSYLLTTPTLTNVNHRGPTRLQLLAAERGGTGEDAIHDDELFAEGELESMLRDDDEAEDLREVFGWNVEEEESVPHGYKPAPKKRKREPEASIPEPRVGNLPRPGTSKLNMEALTRFMRGSDQECEEDKDSDNDFDMTLLGLNYGLEDKKDSEDEEFGTPLGIVSADLDSAPTRRSITAKSTPQIDLEEIVLNGWRPMTPDCDTNVDDRYEEQYD